MDRDAIIREWFYRLPKGYATTPYSKEEMNVLHEVLAENGLNGSVFVNEVDQLDQAFIDAEPPQTKEKTHTLSEEWIWEDTIEDLEERILTEDDTPVPTIEELATLLSNTDAKYSDKVLKRVGELLNIDTLYIYI